MIPGTSLRYGVPSGDARKRAQSINRERLLRRLSFWILITYSVAGVWYSVSAGTVGFVSPGILGLIVACTSFVNLPLFGFCDGYPPGVETMSSFKEISRISSEAIENLPSVETTRSTEGK